MVKQEHPKLRPLIQAICGTLLLLVMGGCMTTEGERGDTDGPGASSSQALQQGWRQHRLAGGVHHSLAVRQDGTVWAWGKNTYGQIGDNTTTSRHSPVQVASLTGAVTVAAGDSHSLALMADGTVRAWGHNNHGQLGDNTVTARHTPVPVVGLGRVVAVAAGWYHSLALKSDGTVWAWGYNAYGQLGDSTASDRYTPQQVQTASGFLNDVVAIAANGNHSLALKSNGTVWAFGYNAHGELGNGTTGNQSKAGSVSGLTDAVAVAAGATHSAAIRSNGTVVTWGYNSNGQLGNKTKTTALNFVDVQDLTDVKAISLGNTHTVALRTNGSVMVWGSNSNGQLCTGTTTAEYLSPTFSSLGEGQEIASGHSYTLALQASGGAMKGCGYGYYGELGHGVSVTTQRTPVTVAALSGIVEASGGEAHTIALKWDGTVWGWGLNASGQLGDGTWLRRLAPTQVKDSAGSSYLTGIVAVVAGANHSMGIRADGTVWAWGYNAHGQLGNGTTMNQPLPVQVKTATVPLDGVVAIAAGNEHSLALRYDGTVWAWGYNKYGQLGRADSRFMDSIVAVQVMYLENVMGIAAGGNHSLAVATNGAAYAWGNGEQGQLCDYTSGVGHFLDLIFQIPEITTATRVPFAVAAGAAHSLMLLSNGSVFGCGANGDSQLGNGTTTDSTSPVRSFPSGAIRIAAGGNHSIARKDDGTTWAWGDNTYGQLGDGSTMDRSLITQVAFPDTPPTLTIAAGKFHSVAALSDGRIWTWGRNHEGQLGNGAFGSTNQLAPIQSSFSP